MNLFSQNNKSLPNHPPEISGAPEKTIVVGDIYDFKPTAIDPDGDVLSYSITNKPKWASFDTSSGILTGQPGNNDTGIFSDIIISVSDNKTTTTLSPFTIDVKASISVNSPCSSFYQSGFQLTPGFDAQSPSTLSKPSKGIPYTDPAYGTCVVRATDHMTEAGAPPLLRNDYSRRNPFNADNTLMFVYARGGTWHLYDAETLKYLRKLPMAGDAEPQWDSVNPNIIYFLPNSGGLVMYKYDVTIDTVTTAADFTNVTTINGFPGSKDIRNIWPTAEHIWTRSEGSPSANGRYWGFQVDGTNWVGVGMFVYDLQTNTILGTYDFEEHGMGRPNNVSMSPSGKYIVVGWYGSGGGCQGAGNVIGTYTAPCGAMSFSSDFTTGAGLAKQAEHMDTAIDVNGNDVLVIANYTTGFVEMISLATGEVTQLWNIYLNGGSTSMHISGKAFNKPGWVLISTYNSSSRDGLPRWYNDKLMAVELKANPTILNIAHTYDINSSYWNETQAATNRDFTKILFNSNWQSGTDDVDAYLVEIPAQSISSGN